MNIKEAKHSPKGTEYEHWDLRCWDSNWPKILNSAHLGSPPRERKVYFEVWRAAQYVERAVQVVVAIVQRLGGQVRQFQERGGIGASVLRKM